MLAPVFMNHYSHAQWSFLDRRMLQEFRQVRFHHPDAVYARLEPILQLAITGMERDEEIPDLFYYLDYLHVKWEDSLETAECAIWHDLYLTIAEQLPPLPEIEETSEV